MERKGSRMDQLQEQGLAPHPKARGGCPPLPKTESVSGRKDTRLQVSFVSE